MAKVTGVVVGKVKRSPVKAGSTPRPHGGVPTQAIIKLRSKIIERRRNG